LNGLILAERIITHGLTVKWKLFAGQKKDDETEIPVLDFCNKLRMTEEEAEKLEDDRVVFNMSGYCWSRDGKVLKIPKGYIAKVNEDGTEVTLHKK